MSQDYLARIATLENVLRQKDNQLSLVAETEAFLRSALARAEEKIEQDEREIEHLRAQLEKLRCMMFGTRSEKLRRQVEEAEALLKQHEQENDRYSGREDDPQVPRQLRQSRHRRPLPENLPREIRRLEPAETSCPGCGSDMKYLSEVSAEQLELVTSALKVIRTPKTVINLGVDIYPRLIIHQGMDPAARTAVTGHRAVAEGPAGHAPAHPSCTPRQKFGHSPPCVKTSKSEHWYPTFETFFFVTPGTTETGPPGNFMICSSHKGSRCGSVKKMCSPRGDIAA